MNNILLTIIGGVIVIGGGAYLLLNGSNDTSESISDTGAGSMESVSEAVIAEDGDVPESFNGTMAQLLALGKNITCEFTQNDDEMQGIGTVYISGDRMRGDFKMMFKQGDSSMEASMIQKDGIGYAWGNSPFGPFSTKVNIEEDDGKDQPVDFDEELDYSCKKWRVDNSKFNLPTGVKFDDINAEVQQINENTELLQNAQCGACDQIPDPAGKAQCQAMLGC